MESNHYVTRTMTELGVFHYGFDHKAPGEFYGPAIWDCYLIHYIREGCGHCIIDGKQYHLHKHQGFLIQPGQIAYYETEGKSDWKYCYIGFDGTKAKSYLEQAHLTKENPIFTFKLGDSLSEAVKQLIDVENDLYIRETSQMSLIFKFISLLIENSENRDISSQYTGDRSDYYIETATTYMINNYSKKISMEDVAKHVGLNSSYLGSLFKTQLSISPKEFLQRYRVERACKLMNNHMLTIGDISRSVGYEDQLQFSKVFKKVTSVSPKKYRDSYFLSEYNYPPVEKV